MTTRYLSPQAYDRVVALVDERRTLKEAMREAVTLAEKLRLRRRIDEIGVEIERVEG